MHVSIKAEVFQTEDQQKVLGNMMALFPEAKFRFEGNMIVGESTSLDNFRKLIGQQRIRSTIERILEENYSEGKTSILLNKQCRGIINIYEKNELGPISVVIDCEREDIKHIVWG